MRPANKRNKNIYYAKYKSRKQSMSMSFKAWILTDSSNEDVNTALVNLSILKHHSNLNIGFKREE